MQPSTDALAHEFADLRLGVPEDSFDELEEAEAAQDAEVRLDADLRQNAEDAEVKQNAKADFAFNQLVRMQATRQEVIRGIPAFRAMMVFARLWFRGELDDTHEKYAEQTAVIDEFWSHSWQTRASLKYACVLFSNNAAPAFLVGMLLAATTGFLYIAGILPETPRTVHKSAWCTFSGILGYYFTLPHWRCSKKVFVDVACISQYDPVLKKEGIVSIGGFLKKSKRLLVMWDETVMTRLWCVFELAAYLHSREGVKKTLTVSPAFVGATLLMAHLGFSVLVLTYTFALGRGPGGDPNPSGGSIFFPWGALVLCGLCFPCLTMFCSVLLEHCRSIDRVRQQVGNFTVQHAVSGCCAANHVTATGKPIMCDREIILRCVVGWFGSVSKFEANVQGELCGILVQQLYYDVFSYWRLVIVTSPIGWLMLDHWCGRFAQDGQLHAKMIIAMATAWLVFFPTLFLVILKLAHKLRNACQTRVKHLLVSMFLVLIGVGIFAAFVMGLALSEQLVEDEVLAQSLPLAVLLPVALCVWRGLPRARKDGAAVSRVTTRHSLED